MLCKSFVKICVCESLQFKREGGKKLHTQCQRNSGCVAVEREKKDEERGEREEEEEERRKRRCTIWAMIHNIHIESTIHSGAICYPRATIHNTDDDEDAHRHRFACSFLSSLSPVFSSSFTCLLWGQVSGNNLNTQQHSQLPFHFVLCSVSVFSECVH